MIVGETQDDELDECEPHAGFAAVAVASPRVNEDLVCSMEIGTDDVVPPQPSKEDRRALSRALRYVVDLFRGQ